MFGEKVSPHSRWTWQVLEKMGRDFPELADDLPVVCERLTALLFDRMSEQGDSLLISDVSPPAFRIEAGDRSIGLPTFIERAEQLVASLPAAHNLGEEEVREIAQGVVRSYFGALGKVLGEGLLIALKKELPAEIFHQMGPVRVV